MIDKIYINYLMNLKLNHYHGSI